MPIGDCADIDGVPLPPTAMVAEQQGAYLAKCFNEYYADYISVASDVLGDVAGDMELPQPGPVRPAAAPFAALWFVDYAFAKVPHFRYVERGAMASMGMGGGILDLGKAQQGAPGITGVAAAAVEGRVLDEAAVVGEHDADPDVLVQDADVREGHQPVLARSAYSIFDSASRR